jgi:hypothetical protein
MHTLTKTQFLGLDNIPLEGGLIIDQHLSYIDIPLIFTTTPTDITAIIYKYQTILHPWFSETGGYLDRPRCGRFHRHSQGIQHSRRQGRWHLSEGTRSHTISWRKGNGVRMLALKVVFYCAVGIQDRIRDRPLETLRKRT